MSTGVVLLHGKWDAPPFAVAALAGPLAAAGCAVRLPTLPWALRRLYDAPFDAALDQIAGEAAALHSAGCDRILLCGHSLGACAALATAAQRGGIDGLILLAPGHFPERLAAAGHTGESLQAARAAVAAGHGARRLPLVDVHQGRVRRLRLRPDHYLGYFSPDGPAVWPTNAARLGTPLPMLWLTPHSDTVHAPGIDYAFERAAAHPASDWRRIAATHHDTPAQAIEPVLDWLHHLHW